MIMKKFLRMMMTAVLAVVCNVALAEEVTFTLNDADAIQALGITLPEAGQGTKVESITSGEVNIAATTAEGKTDTRIFQGSGDNAGKYDFRIYENGTLTFTASDKYITEIQFTGKSLTKLSATNYTNGTWKGSEKSVTFKATATATIYTITVQYQATPIATKKEAGLAFSATTAEAVVGEAFTAPTFTKNTNAAIKFTSSNTKVATVDETTGTVTLVAAGTTTIKASAEENDEYYAGEASYALTVTESVKTEVEPPYSEAFSTGIGSFTIKDVSLGEGLSYVWKHDSKNKYMKASAYASKNIASESWIVSPTIDMTKCTVAKLSFAHCINKYFGDVTKEATLWIKEENGEWQQLTITYPDIKSNSNWSSFADVELDIKAYAGKKVIVGFKYISSDTKAGTWEVKNFSVLPESTGINTITTDGATDGVTYNLAGQRVAESYKGAVIRNGKKFIQR